MTIRVEEKNIELAIVKAASKLGVTQSKMAYKIVSTNPGLFGIFGKRVCIEAWTRKSPITANDSTDHPVICPKALQEELRVFLADICTRMCGEKVKVKASLIDERLVFDICNETIASQLAKSSKIAEAFEHLLRKKPKGLKAELPFRIFVDANNIRRAKEQELITMAKDLSDRVFENQKPIVLNYQSPYDRKIIHMALDQDERVYTKSIGVGNNRKLMILPTKEAHA